MSGGTSGDRAATLDSCDLAPDETDVFAGRLPAVVGTMSGDGEAPVPQVRPKTILYVGAWGATTTLIAYVLARGSIVLFVVWLFVIAIVVRVIARLLVARRGERPPKGWWYR